MILNKDKTIEETIGGSLSKLIKESKLDSFVYYGKESKFTEFVNKLVSSGETWKLKDIYALEYENLNGSILKNSKEIEENHKALIDVNDIEVLGDFDKNFTGIFLNKLYPSYKIGIFKRERNNASSGAGVEYDNKSTTTLISKKLNKGIGLILGYKNYQNRYENNSKIVSDDIILGIDYKNLGIFTDVNYKGVLDFSVGFNDMKRIGSSSDFTSYSFSIFNSLNRSFEMDTLDLMNVEIGIKSTIFGYEKIEEINRDLDTSRDMKIDKKLNLSNVFELGLRGRKTFALLEVSGGVIYEKELMNEKSRNDSIKLNGLESAKYSKTIKNEEYGKLEGYTRVDINLNESYSTGMYLKLNSEGYKELGMEIKVKI